MKKGFTLIEMLGIITLIALVLLIAFPNISKSLKQAKINNTNNYINNLKMTTETYIELNREKFKELDTPGNSVTITIEDLYNANLLKGKNDEVDLKDTIKVEKTEENLLKFYYKNQEIKGEQ